MTTRETIDEYRITDPLGIDRRGLYYWRNYSHDAPLHSRMSCPSLQKGCRMDARAFNERFMNEVIVRGDGRGLNFCSRCCERGVETPVAKGETFSLETYGVESDE